MAFERLIKLSLCSVGVGTFVEYAGRELAVFRLVEPNRLFVTDNACPHASGNLAGGAIEDAFVSCPVHHWKFDLVTGQCPNSSLAQVNSYPVKIVQGYVWVDLESHPDNS